MQSAFSTNKLNDYGETNKQINLLVLWQATR